MKMPIHRRAMIRTGAGVLALVPLFPGLGCKGKEAATGAPPPPPQQRNKAEDEAHDAVLLNEGILLEQAAINVYIAAAGLPFIASDAAVLGVAKLFMGQHEEHRDTLAKWVQTLGGTAVDPSTAKTPEIPAIILDENAEEAARKTAVLEFARKLEKLAADSYFSLVSQALVTDFARRSAAEILPVEAQHVAIYDLVLGKAAPVSAAFFTEQT